MKYAIGKAEEIKKLVCSVCKEELYVCDDCCDYIHADDEIQCVDGEHYHKTCKIDVEG